MCNSLQVKAEEVLNQATTTTEPLFSNFWFWIAVIEFLIILVFILRIKRKKTELKFGDISKEKLRNAKKSKVDMDGLMNSINNSKELYKKLSRSCHPDRFINSDKHNTAEDIFQEISKHKRDFNKLTELKLRAIKELNINIK